MPCRSVLFFLVAWLVSACQTKSPGTMETKVKFPVADSAVWVAEQVMKASGGVDNWEKLDSVEWNFFGVRKNAWNKQSGAFSTRFLNRDWFVQLNLHSGEGHALRNEIPVPADSLAYFLDLGRQVWTNDSYWLFMPFKMRDPGVSLRYLGISATDSNATTPDIPCYLLEMAFDSVGYTPENVYRVYVDTSDMLVKEWTYFRNDSTRGFSCSWDHYVDCSGLRLSTFHMEDWQITELQCW